jgi:uncharacterized membrane protein (DUF106 family)
MAGEKNIPFVAIASTIMAAIAALMTLGVISPTGTKIDNMQTVESAREMKTEFKEEFRVNRETHDRIFQELKEQRGEIMSTQIQILRELKRAR